jgi:undecaprenyl-diphosphatase
MNVFQAIVLGTVQGLTEFLPVSSSAHLYIVPKLLGWTYAGLGFDVALHWGTLFALLIAFGSTWVRLARDLFSRDAATREAARSTWLKLIVASVPAAIAGLLLRHAAETWLRYLPLQAAMLAVFGFLLWWVDRVRPQRGARETGAHAIPGWAASLVVGCAQVLALVPGVSRSGATITTGMFMGLRRDAAARFSFVLGVPAILAAAGHEGLHLVRVGLTADQAGVFLVGMSVSAVVGYAAIAYLLKYLVNHTLAVFAWYRIALAAAAAFWLVTGRG